MRVISGELKGRRLEAVPGRLTRPTTDKVKESVFNIVGPYFEGGIVLDLFAGTGSLGIEALSRGMEKAVFIDKDNKALSVVKRNIESFQLQNRTEVYRNDAQKALAQLARKTEPFDLVFIDPPYHLHIIPKLLADLAKFDLVNDDSVLVCEHSSSVELPERIEGFDRWKIAKYGDTTVSFYKKGTSSK